MSLKMLLLLAAGLSLWMLYGFMRGDLVIIAANAVSLALLGGIIFFKLRQPVAPRGSPTRARPAKY